MTRFNGRDGNYNVYAIAKDMDNDPLKIGSQKKTSTKNNSVDHPLKDVNQAATSNTSTIEIIPNESPQIEDTDENALIPKDDHDMIHVENSASNPFPKSWKIAIVCVIVLALFIAAAVFGYSLGNRRQTNETEDITEELAYCRLKHEKMKDMLNSPSLLVEIHDTYVNKIDEQALPWLRKYNNYQVYTSSDSDQDLVHDLVNHLRALGVFDEIKVENYTTLLSLPDAEGNLIQIVNRSTSQVLYRERILGITQDESTISTRTGKNKLNYIPPFVAYSKGGSVQGELVNINYGTRDDMSALTNADVILDERIALLKLGGDDIEPESLIEKIERAVEYNISGILMYQDSKECIRNVNYECLNILGDPQTIGYSAIDGVWKLPEKELPFPDIPLQTISCDTAYRLLQRMSGQVAPSGWLGHYNGTQYMGRKSKKAGSWFVQLDTTNHYTEKTVQNVLATIRGFIYPREMIMLGASRTGFYTTPPSDVTPTETLVKLAQPLTDMIHDYKWLPKRSITFSFWGAAEFGNIGRTEYFEQSGHDDIVTYIDLDEANDVSGSDISIITPDLLHDLVASVVKMRQTSMVDEQAYSYNYEEGDEHGSGYDMFDPIIEAFHAIHYIDPDELTRTQWTRIPLIQMLNGAKKKNPSTEHLQHMEMSRLQAILMLSLADQTVIMYNNVATVKAVKSGVRRLLFQAHSLPDRMKVALEKQAAILSNNTAIFDHIIDNQIDHSDMDFVASINRVLIQLNQFLAKIKANIQELLSSLPSIRPHPDDLELTADLDPNMPAYSAATMRQFSKLLVAMHSTNDLMKTVHFQMISNRPENVTESIEVSDEDYSDLERGWV